MGVVACLVLLAALVAAISAGCGGSDEGASTEGTSNGGSATTGGATVEETTGEPTTGEPSEEPEKPYAALEPSEDAVVLSESVGEDLTREVLGFEDAVSGASGDQYANEGTAGPRQPERSVPLGETLLSGAEDRSDGPLKENRIVAYYGTPLSELMGILGESEPEVMMEQLKEQTQAYSDADPERPAVPAIEFIASVAQRDPGPAGLYVSQTDPEVIEEYSRLAEENDALLILDVQLGGATIMDEIEILEDFLRRPHVHLAIDTEYSIEEGQIPGVDLGTVDGADIQEAVEYFDELVETENIPDKLLMIHQFDAGIVTNKEAIQPTDNVQVALHADGFGTPEAKFSKYGLLVRDEPIQYGGFKVFYQQDTPVLEPEQVLALDPAPAIVTYQ
ncbi:MAG: hypothetical protein ACRDSJ_02205 [Rubrobacteraceae bacterium]